MSQYWEIFNLSYGKVIPVHDGSKYKEKCISIDVLLHLLQTEWKRSKIVMIGDKDNTGKCEEYTKEFLSVYNLEYVENRNIDIENNLQVLDSEGILPKKAYITHFGCSYLDMELMAQIELFLLSKGKEIDMFKNIFFLQNKFKKIDDDNLIYYHPMITNDIYYFIDHTSKEYVKFHPGLFHGFYDKRRKRMVPMTVIRYNPIVINIVLGLITNQNEYKYEWNGRFAGHVLSFEREANCGEFLSSAGFTDITPLLEKYKSTILEDYNFNDIVYTTHPSSME